MWTLQHPDGAWNWLKCNWPPAEADDYYGVTVAALGAGVAPDGYALNREVARVLTAFRAKPLPRVWSL